MEKGTKKGEECWPTKEQLRLRYIALSALAGVFGLILFANVVWNFLSEPPLIGTPSPEKQAECCDQTSEFFGFLESDGHNTPNHRQQSGNHNNKLTKNISNTDLAAQRGMWRATNVVAWVAFAQAVITVFSLVLIWRTLQSTQETLRVTSEASQSALRAANAAENAEKPQLMCEWNLVPKTLEGDKHPFAFQTEIFLTNFGKTPAFYVKFFLSTKKWKKTGVNEALWSKSEGFAYGAAMIGSGPKNRKLFVA